MKKQTIGFFELEPWEQQYVQSQLHDSAVLRFFPRPLSGYTIKHAASCDIIAVFIYSKITAELLAKLPKLRMIATMSTGYDHIDLAACRGQKIAVSNVPTYGENTVAEHTFALILALSRKIVPSISRTRAGNFSLDGLRGFDLKGKTIGIVGCGMIGKHVARIAHGFEMNILVSDQKKDAAFAKSYGITYVSLEELLRRSDIITLHVPLTDATHYLIGKQNISMIKKGAFLINTARGGLIDTNALMKALHKGILGGAALDVLEEEELIKEEKQLLSRQFSLERQRKVLENHMLLTNEDVLVTPHNAFNSSEALQRILDTTLINIKWFLKKKNVNRVT